MAGETTFMHDQRTRYKHVEILRRCRLVNVSQWQNMSVSLIGACGTSTSGSLGDHLLSIYRGRQDDVYCRTKCSILTYWVLVDWGDWRPSQRRTGYSRSMGLFEMSILPCKVVIICQ